MVEGLGDAQGVADYYWPEHLADFVGQTLFPQEG